MRTLLESVPNFSEGRRPEIVTQIVNAALAVDGVKALDLHSDADHNRSVLTLAGPSGPLQEAVFRAVAKATELIDLRQQSGEHPRLGASDVVPFVPLGTSGMQDAVAAARAVGTRIAQELDIPVYFYEEAATTAARRNLEDVRRKGFEELRHTIETDDGRIPDLGPRAIHRSAGATVVGARGPLIAYNIYLNTADVRVAKAIAKKIRHSSGGLRFVKAMGFDIPARGQVQVSMNLTNYQKTAISTVFNMVLSEAAAHGVNVTDSEVVGLIPMGALIEAARHSLRLHDFATDQILETKLWED